MVEQTPNRDAFNTPEMNFVIIELLIMIDEDNDTLKRLDDQVMTTRT